MHFRLRTAFVPLTVSTGEDAMDVPMGFFHPVCGLALLNQQYLSPLVFVGKKLAPHFSS